MWKNLELQLNQGPEGCEQCLMGGFKASTDKNVNLSVDSEGPACEVSETAGDTFENCTPNHLCCILAKYLATSHPCPENFSGG